MLPSCGVLFETDKDIRFVALGFVISLKDSGEHTL